MLALILSSVSLFFLCAVFGLVASRYLRLQAFLTEKLLIGLAVVNTVAAMSSLVTPVNSFTLIFLIGAGILMLPLIKGNIESGVSTINNKRPELIIAFAFIAPAFLVALSAADNNYDTALYHTQSIKWIEEYAVVPGLANLHGRFGFNPNIFCVFALTSLTTLFKQQVYTVNFVVFIILTVYFINALCRAYRKDGINGLFLFLAVMLLVVILLTPNITTPSPDFVALTIPLFILARTAQIGAYRTSVNASNLMPLVILASYVLTVKLSAIPILALPAFLLLGSHVRIRDMLLLVAVPLIIIMPWLVRNVITTGWLVYPMASVNLFAFDWQVPVKIVLGEHESVVGWARNPGPQYAAAAHMDIFSWLPLWRRHHSIYQQLFIVAGFILPLITIIVQMMKRTRSYPIVYLAGIALMGSLFWLMLAPVFRFGATFVAAGVASPLLIDGFSIPKPRPLLLFGVVILILFCFEIGKLKRYIRNVVANIPSVFIKPLPVLHPNENTFRTYKIGTVTVYEPVPGDRCFDQALPCTPYPDSAVVLRGTTLQQGFKVKRLKNN